MPLKTVILGQMKFTKFELKPETNMSEYAKERTDDSLVQPCESVSSMA